MAEPARIAACADLLAGLRHHRRRLAELPAELKPRDEDEAYAVQLAVHQRLTAAGQGPRVGWKIGCTTRVMRDFLQIDQPCAGGILEHGLHLSPAAFRFADLRKPGIECEIAVRIADDVPADGVPYSRDSIAGHVGAVMAAIELVEERFVDFRAPEVDAPSLIADDFFHVGAILGPPHAPSPDTDLAVLAGQTSIDGQLRGTGSGADVMGHPYAALAWLANRLAALDLTLRRGDVVLTGSVVVTQYPDGPAEVRTAIDHLGSVDLRFD